MSVRCVSTHCVQGEPQLEVPHAAAQLPERTAPQEAGSMLHQLLTTLSRLPHVVSQPFDA
ncbi:hypothetical protein BE17_51150 [Sorangium cellulosum]|uniref:Uncharacterized protein n=1 Tax=Sorangium cellulosum TaxID=56 RepID=A0A150R7B0_SORCE|nr:hypothetical protein BE17_51150 [Sorangium cellulosum]